jgi:hypothetical protein
MGAWTADGFAPHLGDDFRLVVEPGTAFDVRLVEVSGGEATFSLVFRGPMTPTVVQRIWPLEHPSLGTIEIFLVPIGPDAEGMLYEAVFS